jgi:hypothetical protein
MQLQIALKIRHEFKYFYFCETTIKIDCIFILM